MLFDSHVHSFASPDSQLNPAEAIGVCKQKGLGITFTEHIDYVTPDFGFDPAAPDKPVQGMDFLADMNIYPGGYERFRCGSVLLGLEIGLTAYYLPLNRQTAHAYDYDFILGSIHCLDGYDMYHDGKNTFGYDRKRRMLAYSLEMVISSGDFIDAFGHIDYLSRYTPAADKIVRYDEYATEYDALLKAVAERGIAMEINTARFGKIEGLEANLARVFARFKELGGRYATIGSDAHNAGALGRRHDDAVSMAREAGLSLVYYKNRKRYGCG
jgi:histidinol-phosphatase (PHP family)